MVAICQDKEDILKYTEVIGLVKGTRNSRVSLADIHNQLFTDVETNVCNITHRMFETPYDAIDKQLELCRCKL
jgi:hypothetical protein